MKLEPHVKRIAIAVVLGAIMSVLSTTIVNVALQTLAVELDAPLDNVQWVVTGYMLSLAAVIPVSGWAAARFGARRLYILSLILFTAGSALCGFAWNLETLVAARVLQGLAGGLLVPIGQIALVKAAGPRNMARVMSVDRRPDHPRPRLRPHARRPARRAHRAGRRSSSSTSRSASSPRSPPSGCCRTTPPRRPPSKLDATGLALVATGLVGITYGLAESGMAGSMTAPEVLVPVLTGIALVATFVHPRAAHPEPAARRPPVRQQGVRGRVGDHVRPRRRAVRRHGPDAAVLPARPRRGRRHDRPAADPAGHRRRARHGRLRPPHRAPRRRAHQPHRRRDHDRRHAPVRPDRAPTRRSSRSTRRWSCAASASAWR